jgi:hypothetical protein
MAEDRRRFMPDIKVKKIGICTDQLSPREDSNTPSNVSTNRNNLNEITKTHNLKRLRCPLLYSKGGQKLG